AIGAISEITGIAHNARHVPEECDLALSAALANFADDDAIREAGRVAAERMRGLLGECLQAAAEALSRERTTRQLALGDFECGVGAAHAPRTGGDGCTRSGDADGSD